MARFTFRLPDIGEGIAEAEIVAWHVKPGDMVEEDGRLADLMTDKATVEMESPVAGTVLELAGEVGEVVAIGTPLVVLETEGDAGEEPAPTPAPAAPAIEERAETAPEVSEGPSTSAERRDPGASPAEPDPAPPLETEPARPEPVEERRAMPAKILASPAVRQRAKELGIALADVRPAEDGRIRHADLDAFLSYGGAKGYASAGPTGRDEAIKVVGLRRRIAENMAASKRNIPHFTYVEECDVTDLEKLRADLNADRAAGPRLTLLPLLIVAVC